MPVGATLKAAMLQYGVESIRKSRPVLLNEYTPNANAVDLSISYLGIIQGTAESCELSGSTHAVGNVAGKNTDRRGSLLCSHC
jgi:hypothetical protein